MSIWNIFKKKPSNPPLMQIDFVKLWANCSLDQNRIIDIKSVCAIIRAGMPMYQLVEAKTGVPWWFIGALHYREASCDFKAYLGNGERIIGKGIKSKLVPKNRGPFNNWVDGAVDALIYDGLNTIKVWDVPTCLAQAEKFNGMGYRKTGELSPYVWAGTNQHDETGKYVADGKYSSTAIEKQLGVAAIIKGLLDNV